MTHGTSLLCRLLAAISPLVDVQLSYAISAGVVSDGAQECSRKLITASGGCSFAEVRRHFEETDLHGSNLKHACHALVVFVLTNPERYMGICPQGLWLSVLVHALQRGGLTIYHMHIARLQWPPTGRLWNQWLPVLEMFAKKLNMPSAALPSRFVLEFQAPFRTTDSGMSWPSRAWADGEDPAVAFRHWFATRNQIGTVAEFLFGHGIKLALPSRVRRVIIDVGVHLATPFQRRVLQDPKVFVVGFEPQHRIFAAAALRAERTMYEATLNRFLLVPAAVGLVPEKTAYLKSDEGWIGQFNVAGDPATGESWYDEACSSLEVPIGMSSAAREEAAAIIVNANETALQLISRTCAQVMRKEEVLVVPLSALLSRLPNNVFVELLKIDAQGHDLSVVESGSAWVSDRVQRIQMEVQDLLPGHAGLGYIGQPVRSQIVERMRSFGFEEEYCESFGIEGRQEMDCWFQNTRAITNTTG